jgi:hypothetical protein
MVVVAAHVAPSLRVWAPWCPVSAAAATTMGEEEEVRE